MRRWMGLCVVGAVCAISAVNGGTGFNKHDREGARYYEVEITNLTRGQQFTPFLVATHRPGSPLFQLGEAAGSELEALAEFGDTASLAAKLLASGRVRDIGSSAGLLGPGQTTTVRVKGGGRFDHISMGAMLIPTNDAFVALNGVAAPRGRGSVSYRAVAYDSGSEINDELCASIPGPDFLECDGPGGGGSPDDDAEGFVHVHAGIHGIGDLDAAQRDWRNPVAAVRISIVGDPGDGDGDGDGDDDDDDDDDE